MDDEEAKQKREKLEQEKARALSILSKTIKSGNENLTSEEKEILTAVIDKLTEYIQKCTFFSLKSRKQKYEDGKKFGKELLELEIIDLCCKTLVSSKADLPAIQNMTSSWLDLTLEITNYSPEVCEKIINYNGVLDYFKAFLEVVVEILSNKKLSSADSSSVVVIAGIIHNCCTCCESVVSTVRKTKILEVLKQILKSPDVDLLSIGMVVTATVADIMDENDSEALLPDGNDARILLYISHMEEALSDPTGSFNGWFSFELCRVIRQLASYDSNKKRLVDLGVLKVLVQAAKCKDDYTQQEAVKALSQLSFDAECQKKMIEENEPVIDTLIDLAKSSDEKIREVAFGAVWTMHGNLRTSEKYAEKVESVFVKKTKGHVMVSYSREQRQMLLDIRKRLEQDNFIVWMDVDQMRGDVYDRMAEAVENASVVLLGMSRSYKMSAYCRRGTESLHDLRHVPTGITLTEVGCLGLYVRSTAKVIYGREKLRKEEKPEAAYAEKLNKQIIPLKVERDFDPDGWLGLMTAGMFFYDYGRKSFDEMSTKLTKELHRRAYTGEESGVEPRIIADAHGSSFSSQPMISRQGLTKESVEKFKKINRNEFEKWLDKNNLPRDKFETFRPKDILYLARMKQEAPEAYYALGPRLFKDKSNKLRKTQIMADLTEALDEFL